MFVFITKLLSLKNVLVYDVYNIKDLFFRNRRYYSVTRKRLFYNLNYDYVIFS